MSLDNISSYLVVGGVSVNVKGFVVVRMSKEAILSRKCFHLYPLQVSNKIFAFQTCLTGVQECVHVEATCIGND